MSSRHLRTTALMALLVAAAPMYAQGVNAQLAGTVNAKSGEALAGANVVVRNAETGFTRTIVSDSNGRFVAVALPVGPYTVTITKAGFQAAGNIKVNLTLGAAAPLMVKLVPVASTTVEVIAVSSQVDTERASSATLMNPEALTNLPVNGRNFSSFALLTPQVTLSSERGNIAIGGQRGINTSINIDGGDYNDPFFGGTTGGAESKAPFSLSIEAIREFQVITDGAPAEFGRMGGGYLNAITKSGTNELTGSLFYYTRPRNLVAKDHQSGLEVSDFKTQQFGGSVGGPIIKDKLFYFIAFDGQRESRPVDFVWGGNSPAALDGSATNVAVDPYNNDAALIARDGRYSSIADANTLFARLDWFVNLEHALQFRVNHTNFSGDITGRTTSTENTSTDDSKVLSLVGQWNWTIGSSWLNEFRYSYVTDEKPRVPKSRAPQVNISNIGFYGGYPFSREFETKRTQFTESLTYLTPSLQVKGGFDLNLTDIFEVFAGRGNGEYLFSSLTDFRLGNWSTYRQFMGLGGRTAQEAGRFSDKEKEFSAFIQGDWRASDSLKVVIGLRYDRQEHSDFPIANFTNPLAATAPLTWKIPTDSQISPRLSFTWTPTGDNGRTVVRGNAGSYVSRTPSVFLYQVFTNNGVRAALYSFTGSNATQVAAAAALGVGRGAGFNATTPAALSGVPSGPGSTPELFTFDQNFKNPRTDRANLGIERAYWDGWVFGFSGSYAAGKYLERLNDINLGTPVANPTTGRLIFPSSRPNTNYGRMMVYSSDAESKYYALTLSAKFQRESSPLQAQVFYTYAKDKDNDSNERNFAGYTAQNTQRLQDEYSWSANDRRHVVTGYVSYLEKRWTGLQMGFNFRYLSGTPYTVTTSTDINLDRSGSSNDRLLGTERNDFREASKTFVDLKLSRDWMFGGKYKLTASAEVFNLFNHVDRYDRTRYTGGDDPNAAGSSKKVVSTVNTAISSSRQVQLGARFSF